MIELNEEDKKFLYKHRKMIEQENFDGLFGFKNRLPKDSSYSNGYQYIINYFYNDIGINILDYMTFIPSHLFSWTTIKDTLIIPNNIKSISAFALKRSNVETIINQSKNIIMLPYHCFEGNATLKTITGLNDIQDVGESCFRWCRNLTSISLPNCKTISSRAFSYCTNLEIIDIPKVEEIGYYCFVVCGNLKKIKINKMHQDAIKKAIDNDEKWKGIEADLLKTIDFIFV